MNESVQLDDGYRKPPNTLVYVSVMTVPHNWLERRQNIFQYSLYFFEQTKIKIKKQRKRRRIINTTTQQTLKKIKKNHIRNTSFVRSE